MQKLVTIYLDNMAYEGSTMFKGHAGKHGHVEEHLKAELGEGWWIVSTTASVERLMATPPEAGSPSCWRRTPRPFNVVQPSRLRQK